MTEKITREIRKKEKIPGRLASQLSVNAANMIDNADQQLFPSLYTQIETSLGLNALQLGSLTTARSLLQSVSTPLWGWWSDRHSRKKVLAAGCFLWGIFTILMVMVVGYIDMLIFRAITGIGLAVIVPTTQSIIADYFPPEKRGKAFGWLGLTGIIGMVFGTIFATAVVAGTPTILGMDSWRFVFVVWGIISIVIGFLVLGLTKDPVRGQLDFNIQKPDDAQKVQRNMMSRSDFKKILTNKTFLLIILQGVIGSIAWSGIFFMIMWWEFIGFSSIVAGLMFSIVAVGYALGNIFGGWIGDKAAEKSPKRGRLIIAQISVFTGIPLSIIIFMVIPEAKSSMMLYLIFGTLTGFLKGWPAPGANSPIFSQIFEPEIRSSVYSVDRMFEGSIGAFGSLIVGAIAGIFGYVAPPTGETVANMASALRIANAHALAMGMFYVTLIPWIVCLILYSLVYLTYPNDLAKMQKILEERRKNMM